MGLVLLEKHSWHGEWVGGREIQGQQTPLTYKCNTRKRGRKNIKSKMRESRAKQEHSKEVWVAQATCQKIKSQRNPGEKNIGNKKNHTPCPIVLDDR